MSEPVYRPGPLNWTHHAGYSMAHTPWGTYTANDICWWFQSDNTTRADSRPAAIAACEADYRERLLRCLVRVVPEPDPGLPDVIYAPPGLIAAGQRVMEDLYDAK